jgi:SSS family solute:Na+ symporter
MLTVAYGMQFTGAGAVRANLTVVGLVDLPLFVITVVFGLFWKRTTWQGATAGFFGGGVVGILSNMLIGTKNFNGALHPFLGLISRSLAAQASVWHAHLKVYEPSLISISPFISSSAAIVLTVLVTLVTKQTGDRANDIWKSFTACGKDKTDTFHLVPRSAAGKLGLSLLSLGFAGFVVGVISASRALPMASTLALGGMTVVFAGGILRVYSE